MGLGDKNKNETTPSWSFESLKKRNQELEEQLKQSKEREDQVRRQLLTALDRLRVAEDGEERLCSQLADLEAEALELARDYQTRILSLSQQLSKSKAQNLLNITVPS